MKYTISFWFLFSIHLRADPIYFSHEGNEDEAKIYKQLMMEKYGIPGEMISVKTTKNCEEVNRKGKLDLCLKKNGDLYWVSVDHHFVNESLKIFQSM